MMKNEKVSKLYMYCVVLFVTCLLISNVAAVKLVNLGPLTLTAAVVLFPITYIVNDILAEVYGYRKAKMSIYIGFIMNLLMVVFFQITIAMKHPVFFEHQTAYATILGNTPRLLMASLLAYLVGSTLNAKTLVTMRHHTKNKNNNFGLFLRCIVSTAVGESIDSIIFVTVAFIYTMPMDAMLLMILTQAGFKTAYEIVIFPFTNLIINKVKKIENTI